MNLCRKDIISVRMAININTKYCFRPAVILDVLRLGNHGVVEMTGGAEQIIWQPVLVVSLDLRRQEEVNKLRKCGSFLVPKQI